MSTLNERQTDQMLFSYQAIQAIKLFYSNFLIEFDQKAQLMLPDINTKLVAIHEIDKEEKMLKILDKTQVAVILEFMI